MILLDFIIVRLLPGLTDVSSHGVPLLAVALLAPDTRMEDVFFSLYNWLNNHPTEAVLVSINHEGGTGTSEDPALYVKLYDILNTPLAQKYWIQTNGTVRPYQPYIYPFTFEFEQFWFLFSSGR